MNRMVLLRNVAMRGLTAHHLLSRMVRDNGGTLRSAYVVNGAWDMEIRHGRIFARRYPEDDLGALADFKVFPVPDDWDGDYNEIMQRAEAAFRNN